MAPFDEKDNPPLTSLERISRRVFLTRAGAAGVASATAAVAAPLAAGAQPEGTPGAPLPDTDIPGAISVSLKVNGQVHRVMVDPRATVLDTLRETLSLTGTKKGCDHGQCGACTVHLNGRRVNSCLLLASMHQNDEITTIEGIGTPDKMHPMQASFVKEDGYQCGYCTSGQIMSAVALLKEPVGKEDADVREAMSGNICRCGAYPNIVAAVQAVRRMA